MVKFYKIRRLTKNNKTGDTYGISLPSKIIESFGKCQVSLEVSGTCIILKSGASFNYNEVLNERN